jgi:sugar/nucleoside kinase (ribokinase family)
VLTVIGDVVQDIVVWCAQPRQDATDTQCRIHMMRGGSAANVAAFAAPRCATRFIGCVGDDMTGRALVAELEGHGVDVRVQMRGVTGVVVVMVAVDGERSMFPSRGASGELQAIAPEWLDDVDLLHVTGYSLQGEPAASSIIDAARRVRAAGGRVCFDASSAGMIAHCGVDTFRARLLDLAPDIISANRDEAELLQLTADGGQGAFLTRLADTIVLARAAANPTCIWRGSELIAEVPVPPVAEIRDVTGAGDAFNAGFLAALADDDLVMACRAGHALAGQVIACPGAALVPGARDKGTEVIKSE